MVCKVIQLEGDDKLSVHKRRWGARFWAKAWFNFDAQTTK
jgi:hypothetical protein